MKYCTHCANELEDQDSFCPKCGKQQGFTNYYQHTEVDAPNAGFAVLCFFFPTVGLILYLVWMDKYPMKAKSCGKGALIGLITSVGFGILYFIIMLIFFSSFMFL